MGVEALADHVAGVVLDLQQQRELTGSGGGDVARHPDLADDVVDLLVTELRPAVVGGVFRGVAAPRGEHAHQAVAHGHRAAPPDHERGVVLLALVQILGQAVLLAEHDLHVLGARPAAIDRDRAGQQHDGHRTTDHDRETLHLAQSARPCPPSTIRLAPVTSTLGFASELAASASFGARPPGSSTGYASELAASASFGARPPGHPRATPRLTSSSQSSLK